MPHEKHSHISFCTDTQENADRIAKSVKVEYESLGPPLVTTEDAVRANAYAENVKPTEVKVGDVKSKSADIKFII